MGKYDPLRDYLTNTTGDTAELSFADVERIIGAELPASSHGSSVAWSNSYSHSKGTAWLDAGWLVSTVDMQAKAVVFRRATPAELDKYKPKGSRPASPAALVVRAGPGGMLAAKFWDRSLVAVGWSKVGDLSAVHDGAELRARIDAAYDFETGRGSAHYYELEDFVLGLEPGVRVVTPDPGAREYFLGTVSTGYEYDANSDLRGTDEPYRHMVRVNWLGRAPRDALSDSTRAKLDRRNFTVAWIDEAAVSDLWEAAGLSATSPRYWVEKSLVTGRSDRGRDQEHGLGHALWSPKKDARGADIYRSMREVRPGDVVVHLVDNAGFAGVSVAASSAQDFTGPAGTDWGGRDGWRIALRDYVELDPQLSRDEFLSEGNKAALTAALDSGANLFYNRGLNLNQGAYLTELPRNLVDLLDATYMANHGRHLPHFGAAASPETPLLAYVRVEFPGWQGFADEEFVRAERDYKLRAAQLAASLLGAEPLRALIGSGDLTSLVPNIKRVASATNLLYLSTPVTGDLAALCTDTLDLPTFAEALFDLLHGQGSGPERLGRFASYLEAHDLPNKWPLPTYLLMLLHPETEVLVKPQTVAWALTQLGHARKIGSRPNADDYAFVLQVARGLFDALRDYGPHDFIDVQGYLWAARRGWEKSQKKQLSPAFAALFDSWDEAWSAFDQLSNVLVELGVASPDDERFALTLTTDSRILTLDFGRWLIWRWSAGGKEAIAVLPVPRARDLGLQAWSQDEAGFVGSRQEARCFWVPRESMLSMDGELKDAYTIALQDARSTNASFIRSPYRKSNRPNLAAAVFDEEFRTQLLSGQVDIGPTEEKSPIVEDIYSQLAAHGFHFPEWVVTDYVLSLGTKPLVILSGISGTGKTQLAQQVANHVTPDVVVLERLDAPPAEQPGSWIHIIGRNEHMYNSTPLPKRTYGLLERMPESGDSLNVDLVFQGQHYEARMSNYTNPGNPPMLELWWKKSFRSVIDGSMREGDYLRFEPRYEGDALTIAVIAIPAQREERPEQSPRIAFLSVRPDWTDNRGLLGYYNPLLQKYQATELLRLLLRARANPSEAHFVILDEMNLAKVEYYFSDFLSALEADTEMILHDSDDALALEDLDSASVPRRLRVPSNVFFTGTVNVDETTYMFSPKVLDRANTLEFNEVDLVRYGTAQAVEADGFRLRDDATVATVLAAYHKPSPADWLHLDQRYKDRLGALHALLHHHNLHFGYRVANEIARYLSLTEQFVGADALDIAFDLQVLQKVLPKFSGSRAKLEGPLQELHAHLAAEGLVRSEAKVARMLETLRTVGFVSFVE